MSFETYSQARVPLINSHIRSAIERYRRSVSQRFIPLVDSMQYSLESGGKRLRPMLVLASAECLGLTVDQVMPAAAAIEFIHTYSLIHDDLPPLDDDDTRRGKPSSHKKFGEAVAILTGDALLTEAFSQMLGLQASGRFEPTHIQAGIELLVQSSGVRGMVGGQLLDVTTSHTNYSLPEVEFIHIHKTGAMILCSVLLPTRLIPMDEARLQRLRRYGETVGLAFQISDDLLDSEATIRYSRPPRKKPKPSFTHLMSPSEMREKLNGLIDTAVQSVLPEGDKAKPLVDIAEFIRIRKH